MASIRTRNLKVALLTLGSAILLFSCEERDAAAEAANDAARMTEYSENLSIVMSQNGMRSYFFETPLLEGYSLAAEPYREFRRGIRMTTYQDDSLSTVDAVLTANYAIYYENRKLWEAKGDVVVTKSDGKKLFTSQLFWNQATGRIYSNVDSKIVDGDEVYNCEGFETDESMNDLTYRKLDGVTYFTSSEEAEAYASGGSGKETASATSDSDAAASAAPAEDAD